MSEKLKMISFSSKLNAFFQISRGNLLLASIGHATLGMLFAASSFSALYRAETLLYIILHYIIALFGCNINSYFDYDVDLLYKKYLANSIDILGKSNVQLFIIIEGILAISLIALFLFLGYWIVSLFAMLGFIGALLYSAEPVRIKKHGLASPIPVFILYTFPLLGGWFLFRDDFTGLFLLFIFGYMLMNEGFTLVNTCEDFSEDKKSGITTWAHIFGLKKTLNLAFLFSFSGLFCVIALGLKVSRKDILFSIPVMLFLIALFFTTISILKASFEVRETYRGKNLENRAKLYGVRLQRWFMMTRYPLMITALLQLWLI